MRDIRPREKLEFIIDSCSSGQNVLDGVSRIIDRTMNADPRVFDDYRIVMPIQLGTETKRYLFPDFLHARLGSRDHGILEEFYQRHRNKVRIVETDISRAFKWHYGALAARILREHPEWEKEIVRAAMELQRQIRKPLNAPEVTLSTYRLQRLCDAFVTSYEDYAEQFGDMRRDIVRYGHECAETDAEIDRRVREAENIRMGRAAREFFDTHFTKNMRLPNQYLLQAMYAHDRLHREVSQKTSFSSYRKDKGERAIESFLFSERAESHPERVTVIVSEDAGARKKIQQLRRASENTIFVVSSYGFAIAQQKLGMIKRLSQMLDRRTLKAILAQREDQIQTHIERLGYAKPSMEEILDRRVEEKWADRLVQVLDYGAWLEKSPTPASPRITPRPGNLARA